jgi:hypothetical protein
MVSVFVKPQAGHVSVDLRSATVSDIDIACNEQGDAKDEADPRRDAHGWPRTYRAGLAPVGSLAPKKGCGQKDGCSSNEEQQGAMGRGDDGHVEESEAPKAHGTQQNRQRAAGGRGKAREQAAGCEYDGSRSGGFPARYRYRVIHA